MRLLSSICATAFCAAGLLVVGCASTPASQPPSPEQEVLAALEQYHTSERAGDVAGILNAYSDDFEDVQGTDKSVLRGFFETIVAQGILDNLQVDMEATVVSIDGDTALVAPITYTSVMGSDTYAYRLRKEADGEWRFIFSEMIL
jgi:ketosteroid isomerase-like protein